MTIYVISYKTAKSKIRKIANKNENESVFLE